MNRQNLAVGMALGITLAVVAISAFLVVIGSQYSEVSVTRQCDQSGCSDVQQFGSSFVPEPIAVIPLLTGVLAALGLVTKKMIFAWSGALSLLIFSVVLLVSIGLFYVPLAITLVGFLVVIQNHKLLL